MTLVPAVAHTPAQQLSVIEDALRAFAKALRATQLYLPNNAMRAQSLDQTRVAFSKVWTFAAPLDIQVQETSFLWGEHAVYRDSERGVDGLPWLLYRDGLRSLHFHPGFEDADLDALLTLLQRTRTSSPDDDDLVTLLWIADLSTLDYRHVEYAGVSDLPFLDQERTGTAVVQANTAPLGAALSDASALGDGPPPDMVRMEDFDSSLYFLEPPELRHLQDELRREYANDQSGAVLASLFDIIEMPVDTASRLEAVGVLDELLGEFLFAAHYESVAFILRESVIARRGGTLPDEIRDRLQTLPEQLSAPAVITQLLHSFEETARVSAPELLDGLFAELRPVAMEPLLRWLGTAKQSPARAAVERASLRLAGANTAELSRLLDTDDPSVRRGALRAAAQLQSPATVPVLGRLMRDADPTLRAEVVFALSEIGTAGALQALERAIDDDDREVRVACYRAISIRRHASALPRLRTALQRRGLRSADLTEKMALFEAYGSMCGEAGVRELDELLNSRGLIGSKEPAEIRACAARALGLIGTTAAVAALQKSADVKDVVIRSAVARALRGGV